MEWDEEKFIERAKAAMGAKGISQDKLAEAIGKSAGTVSRWLKLGDNNPGYGDMLDIAHALEVTTAWLVFGVEPRSVAAAQGVSSLGQFFDQYPQLMRIVEGYLVAPPEGKRALEYWASSSIHGVQTPALKVPPFTSIKRDEIGKHYEPPHETPETKNSQEVASEPAGAYAGRPSTVIEPDAFEWVRGLGAKMKRTSEVDLSQAGPPIKRAAMPMIEERAAADHLRTYVEGGSGPIVAETEPTEIKYPRNTHFTLKVTGRSMHPTIFEGDRIIVEKANLYLPPLTEDNPAPLEAWKRLDREIIVAIKNEDTEAYVKRVEISKHRRTGWRILLRSDNPGAKSIDIDKEDSLLVVGIVREIVRDPKNVG